MGHENKIVLFLQPSIFLNAVSPHGGVALIALPTYCCKKGLNIPACHFVTSVTFEYGGSIVAWKGLVFMSEHRAEERPAGGLDLEEKVKLKKPSMYKVIMLNDDYTTMEFVIDVLQKFFNKSVAESTIIMKKVHFEGKAVAGTYPLSIAENKTYRANEYSKSHEFPLKCVVEKE